MQQHHSSDFSDHWEQTTEEVLDEIQRRDIKDAENARLLREASGLEESSQQPNSTLLSTTKVTER